MLYYVAALALIVTVGILIVSTAIDIPTLLHDGAFRTSITVLDRVLLVFIFAELLHSIRVILEEDRILVEPFLLIGIIAVIRRILIASAETTLYGSAEEFQRLTIELGVLSALVIALGISFYLEAARIGSLLFIFSDSLTDQIGFSWAIGTFATRLSAQALSGLYERKEGPEVCALQAKLLGTCPLMLLVANGARTRHFRLGVTEDRDEQKDQSLRLFSDIRGTHLFFIYMD
jgi:uncharacterized membrane protein (DUF373 family)